jgi:hypothetical protein
MFHATIAAMSLLLAAQAPTQPPSPSPPRPEVKAEVADDASGWLAPTRVRLDFRDRTLAEVVEGLNAQGPAMLALQPMRARAPKTTEPVMPRYSIVEPAPVTFWEAVDRVARATRAWPTSGNAPRGGRAILLVPASEESGFACHDGAFRLVLTGTSYSSRFQFTPHFYNQPGLEQPRGDGSSRDPKLAANLLIMAEPRLKIVGPVELVVSEATDDRGRSLIPATPWREALKKPPGRSYPNQEHIQIGLRPLDDPGRKIKRLVGHVVLEVAQDREAAPVAKVAVRFDFADVPLP